MPAAFENARTLVKKFPNTQFSALIEGDVFAALTLEGALKARSHIGGTAPARVKAAIAKAKKTLT